MPETPLPEPGHLTLRTLMDAAKGGGRRLPLGVVLRVAQHTAQRLHDLHSARAPDGTPEPTLHGDLRPCDVLLDTDGAVTLRPAGRRPGDERHALYVPPERLDGAAPDASADQYAWGLIVWEMLAGAPLFAGASADDAVSALRAGHVIAPATLREDLPDGVNTMVMRTLAEKPRNRFSDMQRLLRAVDDVVQRNPRLGYDAVAPWVTSVLTGQPPPAPAEPAGAADAPTSSAPSPVVQNAATPYPMQSNPPAVKPLAPPPQRFHNATPFSAIHLAALAFMLFTVVIALMMRPSTKSDASTASSALLPEQPGTPPPTPQPRPLAALKHERPKTSTEQLSTVFRRPPGAHARGTSSGSGAHVDRNTLKFESARPPLEVLTHYRQAFEAIGFPPVQRKDDRRPVALAMARDDDKIMVVSVRLRQTDKGTMGQVEKTVISTNTAPPSKRVQRPSHLSPAYVALLQRRGLRWGADMNISAWGTSNSAFHAQGTMDASIAQARLRWADALGPPGVEVDAWTEGPRQEDRKYVAAVGPRGFGVVVLATIDERTTGFSLYVDEMPPLLSREEKHSRLREGLLEAAHAIARGDDRGAAVLLWSHSDTQISPYRHLLRAVTNERKIERGGTGDYAQYLFWSRPSHTDRTLATQLLKQLRDTPDAATAVALLDSELRCPDAPCREKLRQPPTPGKPWDIKVFEKAARDCAQQCKTKMPPRRRGQRFRE